MWTVKSRKIKWPKLEALEPEYVLDEYDGPRLFTVRSDDGHLLLAYQCGSDDSMDRFLLVPADEQFVADIELNKIPLREALVNRSWAWLVDRMRDGSISPLEEVNPSELPKLALPRPDVCLGPGPKVLIRVRMVGDKLSAHHIPASVVRRAIENSTGAMKTLVSYVLSRGPSAGRPAEFFRRYYDLPAVGFSFKSFEIAFGMPDALEEPDLLEEQTLERVQELLTKGLDWAVGTDVTVPEQTPEWSAIADALAKLAPPPTGFVEEVELSGVLTGQKREAVRLTRFVADRIGTVRKRLIPERRTRTHQGYVREFDKDRLSFTLRNARGENIRTVSFSENQYDDTLLAFDANEEVTVVVYEMPQSQTAELISITFNAPPDENGPHLLGRN